MLSSLALARSCAARTPPAVARRDRCAAWAARFSLDIRARCAAPARQGGAHRQARAAALLRPPSWVMVMARSWAGAPEISRPRQRAWSAKRDRQHRMVVLAEQNLLVSLVDHQGHAGLQIERIADLVQASPAGRTDSRAGSATMRTGVRRCARTRARPWLNCLVPDLTAACSRRAFGGDGGGMFLGDR